LVSRPLCKSFEELLRSNEEMGHALLNLRERRGILVTSSCLARWLERYMSVAVRVREQKCGRYRGP
jgi:hypothetical protein